MQDKLTLADQETLQIIPETLSNPEKGKVRFLAGWVAFKEQSTCSNYITRNAGSKHKHVQNNTKVEIALLKVIKGMICSRDEVMRNTRAKDTLKHMEYHNRGGLTHVRDEVFLFFERMELCCQRIFTRPLIQQYRDQALLHARKLVKEDPLLLIAWRSMLRSCHFCDNSFDSRGKCKDTRMSFLINRLSEALLDLFYIKNHFICIIGSPEIRHSKLMSMHLKYIKF